MVDRRKMMFAGMMGACMGGLASFALSLFNGNGLDVSAGNGTLVASIGCFVVVVLFVGTGRV